MRRLIALLAAGFACAATAADPRWYLHLDNDGILDTDRWYSSGLRLAAVQQRAGYELELGLLQEIYTPEGERFDFGRVDRAPTARLLFSLARHDRSPGLLQTVELAAGVSGPAALGEEVTEFIHRFVSASPIDWSRQQGDRFDAQLSAVRSHDAGRLRLHYGAVLGNEVAFGHVGAEIRFGTLEGASSPALRYAPTPPWGGVEGWSGFVGLSVRAVGRNRMLKRPYALFGEELERRDAVARAAVGVARHCDGFSFTAAVVAETREFAGQRAAHRFASATVHYEF